MVICSKCGKSLAPEQANSPCPECGSLDRKRLALDGAAALDQAIVEAKTAAAKDLAKKHYEVEDGLMRIFRLTGKAEIGGSRVEPIKLLEVNEITVASGVDVSTLRPSARQRHPFPVHHCRGNAGRVHEDQDTGTQTPERLGDRRRVAQNAGYLRRRLMAASAEWAMAYARQADADFATREEAQAALFEYMEVFYNVQRRHASLGYVSPAEYEQSE